MAVLGIEPTQALPPLITIGLSSFSFSHQRDLFEAYFPFVYNADKSSFHPMGQL